MRADLATDVLSLAQLQAQTMSAILGQVPTPMLIDYLRPRPSLRAEDQLAIYRHATSAVLAGVLMASYPATARLLGAALFRRVATDYVEITPSRSGDLEIYGSDLFKFLQRFQQADIPPAAPELARLEWLIAQLTRAPDTPVLDQEKLAAIAADHLHEVRLAIAPRAALFCSNYPVLDAWSGADIGSRQRVDRLLLVCDDELRTARLDAAAWAFHSRLTSGDTLGAAVQSAIDVDADFDVGNVLGQILRMGAYRLRIDGKATLTAEPAKASFPSTVRN